jgi:hypothetical protein
MKKATTIKAALVVSAMAITLCSNINARSTNYPDSHSETSFESYGDQQSLPPGDYNLDKEFPILNSQENKEFELKMKAVFMVLANDPEVLEKFSSIISNAAERQNKEMGVLGHSGAICYIMAKSAANGCSNSWNFLWPLIKKTGIITWEMVVDQFADYELEYYDDTDSNYDDEELN